MNTNTNFSIVTDSTLKSDFKSAHNLPFNTIDDNIVLIFDELINLIKNSSNKKFTTKLDYYQNTFKFNVNTSNEYGNTLLHTACKNRNYEIVKILLDTYNAKADIKNADGRTPLHIATIYGSTDKTFYIFQNIGSNQQISNSTDIINLIVDKFPHVLLIKDKDNMTPMNYFNSHSDISTNKSLNNRYKNYKRNTDFFNLLKETNTNDTLGTSDYDLSVSIYFALKSSS